MLKIPSSKHDLLSAEAIVTSDWEKVEVLMPDLFEWTQDPNWPVAQVLYPYFTINGDCIAEYVISVLNGNDTEWKYSFVRSSKKS